MSRTYIAGAALWLFTAVGVLAGTSPPAAAPASVSVPLGACKEVGGEVEPDWVLHRCQGYGSIPVWLAFSDSNKSHLGFGAKPNLSGIFGLEGPLGRIEWRGVKTARGFEPYAVIAHVTSPFEEDQKGHFVVYRLRNDRTSCILGETVEADAGSRQRAREIADRARDQFKCEEEPELPGPNKVGPH